ncbi:MAG: hypothetical protein FWE33_05645, partial [Defluviitaleaceae bacterium]|nr:hypothetical protein [Defluviitaleaceae bacterium]
NLLGWALTNNADADAVLEGNYEINDDAIFYAVWEEVNQPPTPEEKALDELFADEGWYAEYGEDLISALLGLAVEVQITGANFGMTPSNSQDIYYDDELNIILAGVPDAIAEEIVKFLNDNYEAIAKILEELYEGEPAKRVLTVVIGGDEPVVGGLLQRTITITGDEILATDLLFVQLTVEEGEVVLWAISVNEASASQTIGFNAAVTRISAFVASTFDQEEPTGIAASVER